MVALTLSYLLYYLPTFSWFVKAYGIGFFTFYLKGMAFQWNNLKETIFFVWHSKMFRLISILFGFFLCMSYKASEVQNVALRLFVFGDFFCILKKVGFSVLFLVSCLCWTSLRKRYNSLKKKVLYSILSIRVK